MKSVRAAILVALLLGTPAVELRLAAPAADQPAAATRPAFAKKPTAKKSGDAIQIDFTADRKTDVAVTIENAKGAIIRHLAAGMLGKNPPEHLQADSLSQSLTWDGKDDFGKPATGGPFRVRVQLGMRPEFDRFLMHNPDGSGEVSTAAVGPRGILYVFHKDGTANGNMGGHKIKVYNRDGKHQKVLAPFPADIDAKKVKALGVFQTGQGDLVPHIHNWETLSFYPDNIGWRGRDMPELSCPAVDSTGRVYYLVQGPALVAVDADGGIPYDTFLGPRLLPEIKDLRLSRDLSAFWSEHPCLAVSSDDKYVYFAGLSTGAGDWRKAQPLPCVFRVPTDKRGPAEVFVGKLDQVGKEKELLTAPRGLAVADGRLYVADPAADRVVVFQESDRSYVGEIAVKNPQVIGVDPASGAVYVCAYTGTQTADLIKFSGLEKTREVCRMKLPRTGLSPNAGTHRIAVDASAKPVRIWLPTLYGAPTRLLCIEDAGDKFVDKGDPRSRDLWAEGPRDITVDRVRGEVYVKANGNTTYRLDDNTGEVKGTIDVSRVSPGTVLASQLVPGQDGDLYVFTWNKGLWRLDHEGKPKKWDGLDTHSIPLDGMMCFQLRHLAVRPYAPADEVYVIATVDSVTKNPKDAGKFLTLNAVGQDGKNKRTLIWQCLNGAIPRLDAKGNIYLADLVKPPDRSYPEFFDGKLPPPPKQCDRGDLFWYSYMYGSILKFPPTGGIIWHQKELPKSGLGRPPAELLDQPKQVFKRHFSSQPHLTGEVQGALWTRFGYAPYSAHMSGNTSHCMCEGSGFDVDPFGRVFFPNLGQFRIEVIDTNNNPITTFGQYGNEDSGGPDARVKKPDIPLAWPTYVAVSDRWAYVADTVNRRVVRVKLAYAAEETCAVP
jgi:DNA-binding beta-propeller fold protein YncE